jgi:hypothetical protein
MKCNLPAPWAGLIFISSTRSALPDARSSVPDPDHLRSASPERLAGDVSVFDARLIAPRLRIGLVRSAPGLGRLDRSVPCSAAGGSFASPAVQEVTR